MRSFWPTGGLWRQPDFLKLWSAETISQFGSQVGQLALPLVAILVLDASAFEVAALGTVRVPSVHPLHAAGRRVGRPAAATTDPDRRRLRPRRAPSDHPDRVLRGCPDARPALRRRVPRRRAPGLLRRRVPVVPAVDRRARADHRGQLEARDQPLGRAGRRPGARWRARPDLHGTVRRPRSTHVSFVGSGLFLLRIRKVEDAVEVATVDGRKVSLWTDLKEGLRFVLGNPNLRAQAGCTATSNFFSSLAFSIFLVFAVRELHLSAGTIGSIFSVGAAGSLAGAFTADAHLRTLRDRPDVDRRRGALRADDSCSSR